MKIKNETNNHETTRPDRDLTIKKTKQHLQTSIKTKIDQKHHQRPPLWQPATPLARTRTAPPHRSGEVMRPPLLAIHYTYTPLYTAFCFLPITFLPLLLLLLLFFFFSLLFWHGTATPTMRNQLDQLNIPLELRLHPIRIYFYLFVVSFYFCQVYHGWRYAGLPLSWGGMPSETVRFSHFRLRRETGDLSEILLSSR